MQTGVASQLRMEGDHEQAALTRRDGMAVDAREDLDVGAVARRSTARG